MEDLFDILLVVMIAIIGGIAKSNKNKKKKAADKPKAKTESVLQVAMGQTAPVQPAEPVVIPLDALTAPEDRRQNIENAIAAFSELLDTEESEPKPKKSASPAKPLHGQTAIEAELQKAALPKAKNKKKLKAGESVTDEHGCIGGSMPVHNAEGESIAEHAEHEENRRRHLQQNTPTIAAETLRRPSNQELRRAIVMSEVLDKPVSLRRR